MSELRQAMIDQMLLKGFSKRTKESYLSAVSLLARHYHLSPDKYGQTLPLLLLSGKLLTVTMKGYLKMIIMYLRSLSPILARFFQSEYLICIHQVLK